MLTISSKDGTVLSEQMLSPEKKAGVGASIIATVNDDDSPSGLPYGSDPAINSYAPQSNNAPEFVFGTNLKYWSDATAFQSANNFDNANFNAIVAMKETAVPFIYKELLKGPTPLVHALDLIYPGVVTYHGFVSLEKSCQTWISILKKIGIE